MANINNDTVRTKTVNKNLSVISGKYFTMIYSIHKDFYGYETRYSVVPTIEIDGTKFAFKTNYISDKFIVFTEQEAYKKIYDLFCMNEQNATYETRVWDGNIANESNFIKSGVCGEFEFFNERNMMLLNKDGDSSVMWSLKIGNPSQFSKDYCEINCEETAWRTDTGYGNSTNVKIYGVIIDDSFVDVDLSVQIA